jgi:hypothetical protein
MGAVADISQQINTVTGGTGAYQSIWQLSDNRQGSAAGAATVAGQWTSLWNFNKSPGGQGAAPGSTARNPTEATTGALGQSDPGGGRQKRLGGWGAFSSVAGNYQLYDRLADISGLNATTTTAQTITGLSVTRYTGTSSVGNEIWLEIYTIIGTTATTITVEYTNQAGTTGRTSQAVAFGGTGRREATRLIKVPLAAGDTGVRAVTNVDLVASTGTAGDFGVTIARPIAMLPVANSGSGVIGDFVTAIPTYPEIMTDACLDVCLFANTTTSPYLYQQFAFLEA